MSKYSIQRYSTSLVIPADDTTIDSAAIPLNGRLVGIMADVPALVGTTTLTLTVKDADGYTIYTKSSIPEGAKFAAFVDANNQPLKLPLSGSFVITATASNTQTAAAATIPVVLLIDRN